MLREDSQANPSEKIQIHGVGDPKYWRTWKALAKTSELIQQRIQTPEGLGRSRGCMEGTMCWQAGYEEGLWALVDEDDTESEKPRRKLDKWRGNSSDGESSTRTKWRAEATKTHF